MKFTKPALTQIALRNLGQLFQIHFNVVISINLFHQTFPIGRGLKPPTKATVMYALLAAADILFQTLTARRSIAELSAGDQWQMNYQSYHMRTRFELLIFV